MLIIEETLIQIISYIAKTLVFNFFTAYFSLLKKAAHIFIFKELKNILKNIVVACIVKYLKKIEVA